MDGFENLLNITEQYIVGVSGGCDSMALLDMLNQAGYQIIVCHVNYHLREDSTLDQRTVETYCQKYQLPCFVKEIDKQEYGHDNFQSQARYLRYQFYLEIGQKYQTNKVILAHHQDDVIENIVMQLQRHNTKGYLGIKEISEVFNMTVIRPCLKIRKQVLRNYCHEHNVSYRDDYTNFQTEFTRDYVRNVVLKDYDEVKISELLKYAQEHNLRYFSNLDKVNKYLERYHQNKNIDYTLIPQELLESFIYEIVKEQVYPPLISDSLIKEIIKQIRSNKPNINMDLPVNIRFIKEYNNICVSNLKNNDGYCLKYDYLVYDKHKYFYLSDEGHLNEGVYVTKEDFPITIRSLQPGDVIVTAGGTKKVSRLFIDHKIPKSERNTWPIVENSQGKIILVPHLAKNIGYLYSKPNIYVVKLETYMTRSETMHKDIKEILISGDQISAKCKELGAIIDKDYEGKEVLLVGLLKGSVPFMAELSKYLNIDVTFDYMNVSSYDGIESKTLVVKQDLKEDVSGKNILIVEDILDTGKTLFNVKEMLLKRKANSVKIVTMLDKEEGRVFDMKADYVGFKIQNAFVVGYGLDFNERYRQLPYVGILKEDCYK